MGLGLCAGRKLADAPRLTKAFGWRRARMGAGLGALRPGFGAFFLDGFFAFAGFDFTGLRRRGAPVRFPPLRDAIGSFARISAGAEAREMVNPHQAFNNGRRAILLLGEVQGAPRKSDGEWC